MKKVKVIVEEWVCKEVEYICEVDDADLEDGSKWNHYGIGYLNGDDLSTDAEGFDAIPISHKVIDEESDYNIEVICWEEVIE